MAQKAERRSPFSEVGSSSAQDHRVKIDAILIDQSEVGQAASEVWPRHFDLAFLLRLERSNASSEISREELGSRPDTLEGARHDPFRLLPERGSESALVFAPGRLVLVPIAHELVDLAPVEGAGLPF